MRAVTALLLTLFVYGSSSQQPASDTPADWTLYQHTELGLSFRHPPNLTIVVCDASSFHIEGLVAAFDLISDAESAAIVLRFMVFEPSGNRVAVNHDPKFLRSACKTYTSMKVGPRDAANCVTCGRGACHWSVYLCGQRQVRVFTLLSEDSEKPGPENGRFPLLGIIQSLSLAEPAIERLH